MKKIILFFKKLFTRKRLSQEYLFNKSLKRMKKEWDNVLDSAAAHAMKVSETGKTCILIKHELLRNEYNDRRTQEQILADIKKRFHKCECMYDFTIMGQTNVRISWEKKV